MDKEEIRKFIEQREKKERLLRESSLVSKLEEDPYTEVKDVKRTSDGAIEVEMDII